MPLAVTHVLLTIIVIDLFRDYIVKNKKIIPLHSVLIGGISGLIPDIDIWFLSFFKINVPWFHSTITHLFLIPLIIALVSIITYKYNKKHGTILGIVAFGYGFHIILDYIFYGTNTLAFWPFVSIPFYGIANYVHLSALEMGLDAIILLVWLWHEEKKHKISDFI